LRRCSDARPRDPGPPAKISIDRAPRAPGPGSEASSVRHIDDELAYADLHTLRRQGVSAQALTDALLERVEHLDKAGSPTGLRSVLAVSETARDEDRSGAPLHGIPVLVKDNIEVAGMPSTAGSTALAGRPPRADAPLVRRLREAGAIILGTTNLSERANIRSARSTSGWSAVGGLTANPWALDRSPGGSSSGSGAALAAGLAPLAIGTETDGSITCPASLNGVTGIKPTVGSLPTQGIVPISASQDSPGPMARTVDDVALLLEIGALQAAVAKSATFRPTRTRPSATMPDHIEGALCLSRAGISSAEASTGLPRAREARSAQRPSESVHESRPCLVAAGGRMASTSTSLCAPASPRAKDPKTMRLAGTGVISVASKRSSSIAA